MKTILLKREDNYYGLIALFDLDMRGIDQGFYVIIKILLSV
jgi:hypothetical protein